MERNLIDRSYPSIQVGNIGQLQTLGRTYVKPGDGYSLMLGGVLALSPLRRELQLDAVIDILSFYIPHRHIYGEDWINFIKQGYDESVSLGGYVLSGSGEHLYPWAMQTKQGQSVPKHIPEGYVKIWNNFCRPPQTVAAYEEDSSKAEFTTNAKNHPYGFNCAWLPAIWNTGITDNITASDKEVTVTNGKLDLYDLAKQEAFLKTELDRELFDTRYRDLIDSMGGSTTIDVDERPELLARDTITTSGHNIDGTDINTLGISVGQAQVFISHQIPRKWIPEHGMIWTMGLVRFPPHQIQQNEYWDMKSNLPYSELAGDYDIIANDEPDDLLRSDIFNDGNSTSLGKIPAGQHWREHAPAIHSNILKLTGYPLLEKSPTTMAEAVLYSGDQYDDCFQTTQNRHWIFKGDFGQVYPSYVPTARTSWLPSVKHD